MYIAKVGLGERPYDRIARELNAEKQVMSEEEKKWPCSKWNNDAFASIAKKKPVVCAVLIKYPTDNRYNDVTFVC